MKYKLDTINNSNYYILYDSNGEEVLRWSKRANTLEQIKKAIAVMCADEEIEVLE